MRIVRWIFMAVAALTLANPAHAQLSSLPTAALPALFGQEAPPSPTNASSLRLIFGALLNPQQYDADPTARMQKLLDESEALRQAREEWRRFWSNDQHAQAPAVSSTPPAKWCLDIDLDLTGCCEGNWMAALVQDCLQVWQQLWARGDYQQAELLAEKAARMAPTNVKARHAHVVAQIINAHGQKIVCSGNGCQSWVQVPSPEYLSHLASLEKAAVSAGALPQATGCAITCGFASDKVSGSCAKGCGVTTASAKSCCGAECCAAAKTCACSAPVAKTCACSAPPACCCAKSPPKTCACCTKSCACAAPVACCCAKPAVKTCACCENTCACAAPTPKTCGCAEATKMSPATKQVLVMPQQGYIILTVPGSNVVKLVPQTSATPGVVPLILPSTRRAVPQPLAIPVSRVVEQPAKRVRLETAQFDAHCDKMTCVGGGDVVLLEGNVELQCRRPGGPIRVTGQRVRVYLNDGTFTVEGASENFPSPATTPARPVSRAIFAPGVTFVPSYDIGPNGERTLNTPAPAVQPQDDAVLPRPGPLPR